MYARLPGKLALVNMFLSRCISFSVFCLVVVCDYVPALAQSPEQATAPGTEAAQISGIKKLLPAKKAYLVAVAAKQQPGGTSGLVPENLVSKALAQEQLTKAMRKWHRFEIVDDVKTADLVLLVVEWEDHHRWGNTIVCRDQLFVFEGGALPVGKSQPLWQGDPERGGKWGGCSGAGEPVQELRKAIDKADKARR